MPSSAQQERDRSSDLLASLYLLLSLAYMVWLMWTVMVPAHRKTALRMRLLRSCIRVTNQLARHAGAASMRRELATGLQQYEVPLWLAERAQMLERAYQQARDVTT